MIFSPFFHWSHATKIWLPGVLDLELCKLKGSALLFTEVVFHLMYLTYDVLVCFLSGVSCCFLLSYGIIILWTGPLLINASLWWIRTNRLQKVKIGALQQGLLDLETFFPFSTALHSLINFRVKFIVCVKNDLFKELHTLSIVGLQVHGKRPKSETPFG